MQTELVQAPLPQLSTPTRKPLTPLLAWSVFMFFAILCAGAFLIWLFLALKKHPAIPPQSPGIPFSVTIGVFVLAVIVNLFFVVEKWHIVLCEYRVATGIGKR